VDIKLGKPLVILWNKGSLKRLYFSIKGFELPEDIA
jgi:hypothetical protein